jgi:cytochrome c553
VVAAGDPLAGKAKSEICAACHNADGNSTIVQNPKIAGQSEKYLINQLIEFRKGDKGNRNEPIMYGMTQALSDQDIEDLAAYYASQVPTIEAADPDLVALGEKLYRGGNLKTGVPACGPACHHMQGLGNHAAAFPRLSGQHPDYIAEELRKYQRGERKSDRNGIMRDIASRLTEQEIKALSSYVSGLH